MFQQLQKCFKASEFNAKAKLKSVYSYAVKFFPVCCPVLVSLSVTNVKMKVNSKYSFTDSVEHQLYKTLLGNFNSTKVGQRKHFVIWQFLHQLTSNIFMNFGNRTNLSHNIFNTVTPSSDQPAKYYSAYCKLRIVRKCGKSL